MSHLSRVKSDFQQAPANFQANNAKAKQMLQNFFVLLQKILQIQTEFIQHLCSRLVCNKTRSTHRTLKKISVFRSCKPHSSTKQPPPLKRPYSYGTISRLLPKSVSFGHAKRRALYKKNFSCRWQRSMFTISNKRPRRR